MRPETLGAQRGRPWEDGKGGKGRDVAGAENVALATRGGRVALSLPRPFPELTMACKGRVAMAWRTAPAQAATAPLACWSSACVALFSPSSPPLSCSHPSAQGVNARMPSIFMVGTGNFRSRAANWRSTFLSNLIDSRYAAAAYEEE